MTNKFSTSFKKLTLLFIAVVVLTGVFLFNLASADVIVTVATGGSAVSADTIGESYTLLSSITLAEKSAGNISKGTLTLNTPTGFSFRTTANSVTATITSIGTCTGSGNKKLKLSTGNGSSATVTPTASSITITINQSSAGNCRGEITWSNIAVRPTSGAPLATGNITKSGSSNVSGIINGVTNFGTLTEIAGAANKLSFQQQPTNITVGGTIIPAVTIQIQDQFGNLTGDTSNITLTMGANPNNATLSGGEAIPAIAGMATFSNLSIDKTGNNYTLAATSDSLVVATSNMFNVVKKQITATVQTDNKIYDGTTSAVVTNCLLDGVINGDSVICSATSAAFNDKKVGMDKTVIATGLTLSGNNADNYNLSSSVAETTADITTKPLTVTANGVNKIYDGNTNATVILSSADLVSGDNVNFIHTPAVFDGADVGIHTIHVTDISLNGIDADNYTLFTTESGTLANITERAAVITLKTDNLIRTYDATPQSVDVLFTDPANLAYLTTYNGSPTTPTSAGSYDVIATITNPNYSGIATTTLVINKANQIITFDKLASKSYGDPDFTVGAVTDSKLNISFAASGNCVISNSIVHLVESGSCNIKTSQLGNGNYNPAFDIEQTFTIAKRPVTIKAEAKNKTYGATDPALTYQVTSGSFAFDDMVSGALSRTSGESVGVYAITAGTLTASHSYDLTFVPGVFMVTIGSSSSAVPMLTTANSDGSLLALVPTDTQMVVASDSFSSTVNIPGGTEVVGPSSWDGVFILPVATTEYASPASPANFSTSVLSAIAIGAENTPLTLNKAVRIVFADQAGKLVGWSRNNVFTEVANVCSIDSQAAGNALPDGSDCKINSESDLVVWTKHFTTYLVYSQTAVSGPPPPLSPVLVGGNSGGNGGSTFSASTPSPSLTPALAPASVLTPSALIVAPSISLKVEKKTGQQIATRTLGLVVNSPSPIAAPKLATIVTPNINNNNLLTTIGGLFKGDNIFWLILTATATLLIIRLINYRKKSE